MGWPRVKIGVLKFHLRRLRPRVREFVFVRIPSEAVRRAGHVKKAVQQELVGGRRRANLPPTQCRQMGRDRSGDFRYSPAREVISFSKSFEQLDELELIDAGAIEYRIDDRGFFPSRKQKLGAAEDRPILPSRFRQKRMAWATSRSRLPSLATRFPRRTTRCAIPRATNGLTPRLISIGS